METKAVDFVQYTVDDLDVSLPFYRDTLGLHLEKHLEEHGWAEFAVPPTTLALREAEADERPGVSDGGAAVALAVDDVGAATEELREEGASVLQEPVDTGVCVIATVSDPDGNSLLLHCRHDGTHGRTDSLP